MKMLLQNFILGNPIYPINSRKLIFDRVRHIVVRADIGAQIKIIFPLIEEHRNSVISKYKNQIEPLLPLRAAYGEEIDEVSGVELGTIAFLVTTGKIMVDANDSDKIRLLKNMRNTLAHIGVIEQNDIDKLFGS